MVFLDKIRGSVKKNKIIIFLLIIAVVNLAVFAHLFGFHPNNDTDSYILSIKFFRGEGIEIFPNRYLNPFYSIIAATILRGLTPQGSIIVTNIFFYFGLVALTYSLLRRVFKNKFIGFISALILITSYPMLRYSLTQVQDIGGYFWFLLTIYAGWCWWEKKHVGWLLLGGAAVSMGVLTKESGCMGALFVGVLFLINKDSWKNKIINFIYFSFLPFTTIVINAIRGKDVNYNSARWFLDNWRNFAPSNYTFFKWFGVHITTYNILWLFIILGLIVVVSHWQSLDPDIKIYLLAIIPSSMSYYAWPLFVGRTVFISAWFFIPIAAYGIYALYMKGGNFYRVLALLSIVVCLITPYFLQGALRYANLFKILDICQRKPICAWNYFWRNRSAFSATGDRNYFDYK